MPASGDPREDRQTELQDSLLSGALCGEEAAKRQECPDLRDEKNTLLMTNLPTEA